MTDHDYSKGTEARVGDRVRLNGVYDAETKGMEVTVRTVEPDQHWEDAQRQNYFARYTFKETSHPEEVNGEGIMADGFDLIESAPAPEHKFKVGDRVKIIGSLDLYGKEGEVTHIANDAYPYRVYIDDEGDAYWFKELELKAVNAEPVLNGTTFEGKVLEVLENVRDTLVTKNKAYGDSALNPVRIFSKADPVEQLKVRIDDKISRLQRGDNAGEDTVLDLIGYLVLLRIADHE